jgi:hypothetical protein
VITQIAGLQSAVHALDQVKLRTAEQHLSAWGKQNCG